MISDKLPVAVLYFILSRDKGNKTDIKELLKSL